MKKYIFTLTALVFVVFTVKAQHVLIGKVIDANSKLPITEAVIQVDGESATGVLSDKEGGFKIEVPEELAKIRISHMAYKALEFSVNNTEANIYELTPMENLIEEVFVSTGYQSIPKERATGSFTFIDNTLLNRKTGGDLLSRLEGVTSSLSFDRRMAYTNDGTVNLRLRGLSTIYSDNQPLIVLDNFPYYGDLNSINPDDVQDITILKDAAAASIWGAKAANGVIVIRTKSGKASTPINISFSSNFRTTSRPDLFYDSEFMDSDSFMEIEEHYFSEGLYKSLETGIRKSILSPYMEKLIDHREGLITEQELANYRSRYATTDLRDDVSSFLFRNSVVQQHKLNLHGGTEAFNYYSSVTLGKNLSNVVGDRQSHINVMHKNTYSPVKNLDISGQIIFNRKNSENNGVDYRSLTANRFPYYSLSDDNGNAMPIDRNYSSRYKSEQEALGLEDWQFRPLDELKLNDKTGYSQDLVLNTSVNYKFLDLFNVNLNYQHVRTNSEITENNHPESYYVRNLVNQYTQPDGKKEFPEGGILSKSFSKKEAYVFRPQLGLNLKRERYSLNGIVGAELSENKLYSSALTLYAYDDQTLVSTPNLNFTKNYERRPFGSTFLPAPNNTMRELVDRFVSYYSNGSFAWDEKYVVSGSLRWDASNLFGVKSNQRGVPLWSLGGSWTLSNESFFDLNVVNYLRLRATYGVNGNLDKSVTAYPVARYAKGTEYGHTYASITNPGNPFLTWEKVKVQNYGIDFKLLKNRLEGSADVYFRKSEDLFGYSFLDPTLFNTGTSGGSYRINYADMYSKGIDIQLSSTNIQLIDFRWKTHLLFNWINNKVTKYHDESIGGLNGFFHGTFTLPVVGKPLDMLYSYPWTGLSADTGDPLVINEGEVGKEYATYIKNSKLDDLVYHGLSVPPVFGSIRNSFYYKNLNFSFNIQYGFNYSFRRSSIDYYNFLEMGKGHEDYRARWQKTGDELKTQVPSLPNSSDAQRSMIYKYSELLVERGDNLRLQDLVLGYTLLGSKRMPFTDINFSANINNLGFIWRKTKLDIDPDYPQSMYPPAKIFTIGMKINL